MTTTRESKRILSVTVKREVDCDPDTSYYGEYASERTSEYSIDRAHSEDCQSLTSSYAIEQLERIQEYLLHQTQYASKANDRDWYEIAEESYDLLQEKIEELQECDCHGGDAQRGEYRYFNPSFNYVDKNGNALPENTADEVRAYVRQDYDRMQAYNNQQWCYMGVSAEARVQLNGDLVQTITSGGLWGIESDAGDCFEEVEREQLDELRAQLHAIGFSKRAITAAMRQVERKGDC